MKCFFSLALLLGLVVGASAAEPLFLADDILALRLQGPFPQMNKDRDTSLTYSQATLSYTLDSEVVELPVELQVRGKRRLSKPTCAFSPIRLIVDKKQAKGTLFEKQKKLKLVVQCFPQLKHYEQYVIAEYLIYRAFNLLTPNSYKVRIAEIEYIDESGKLMHKDYGFIIEAGKRLAKRINRKRLKIPETNAKKLDGEHLNLVSLFQFMVGNVDWSATHGGNEECCHNGKLYGEADSSDNLYIPYDFDMTGLVNPEYGNVSPKLKLKNIRERRYRGYCRNNEYLDINIARFNTKRNEIIGLFQDSPFLTDQLRKKKIAYIEKFYRIINTPKRVKRFIHGWCHASQMVEVQSLYKEDGI